MNMRYRFWEYISGLTKKGMRKNYLLPNGGCDSCCPRCKQWEHEGNVIYTFDNPDGSVKRECTTCSYTWTAIFTPAGFVPVNQNQQDNAEG